MRARACLILIVLSLCGCSQAGVPPVEQSSPTSSPTREGNSFGDDSERSEPIVDGLPELGYGASVGDEFPEPFTSVAERSCLEALKVGVTETSDDGMYVQFLLPDGMEIDSHSAAWKDYKLNQVGLIWELDSFYSCFPYIALEMASESDTEPNWVVTELLQGFRVEQDFGEHGASSTSFEVEGGLISAVNVQDGPTIRVTLGPEVEESKNVVSEAVEEFYRE